MDVPEDILKVLRCTSCEAVLSRGPVFQTPGGETLCGCCVKPGSQASRCLIYEAAAKLLRFPCRNQSVGCKETVPFAFDKEETTHEIACTHRQHLCPVLPAGRCDWLGPRRDMLEHCTECHPALILLNSAQLTHDISTSSLRTFLLPAFHALFLLHTKVCVTSGKIYHAVRRLGDPVEVAKFDFTVDVKRGKQTISKCSSVAPSGCLAIQEDTSLPISINSLLEILGGFDGVLFTVTIFDTTGCKNCNADLPQYIYSDHRGWLCTSCAPPTRPCRNHARGCNYSDFIKKCEKHEIYFCPYTTECAICVSPIQEETLTKHYTVAHRNITLKSGSKWRNSQDEGKVYFISTEIGLVRCRSWPENHKFVLIICCPLPSEQLHEYCCEIKLTDPITLNTKSYTPELEYSERKDWQLEVLRSDFSQFYNKQFDICVTITKIEP